MVHSVSKLNSISTKLEYLCDTTKCFIYLRCAYDFHMKKQGTRFKQITDSSLLYMELWQPIVMNFYSTTFILISSLASHANKYANQHFMLIVNNM